MKPGSTPASSLFDTLLNQFGSLTDGATHSTTTPAAHLLALAACEEREAHAPRTPRLSRAIPVWGKRTQSSKPAIRWTIPQVSQLAMLCGHPRYTLRPAALLLLAPSLAPFQVFRCPTARVASAVFPQT